jgi:hypothetical protein
MKHFFLLLLLTFSVFFQSCTDHFAAINSVSYPKTAVSIEPSVQAYLKSENTLPDTVENLVVADLNEISALAEKLKTEPSDEDWNTIQEKWRQIGKQAFVDNSNGSSPEFLKRWTSLNIALLKLSQDVQFSDELEKMLYKSGAALLSENQIKSVVYTHSDDRIFVNLLGSSSVVHPHTTGGTVKFIQQTNYPEGNEMTLRTECDDTRFMDVFIRIPSWAQNPTVQHGNVKYVARPGEYCEISRKWKNGDEISVRLKN